MAEVIDQGASEQPPGPEAGLAVCPNCGSSLAGAYCSTCGQKNQPLRQPLRSFIQEAFTEYFDLDGRLWRTLGYLLFRPGRLTVEYLEGRRTRFLRPLRIYLSATILFFFLLSVLDPAERVRWAVDSGSPTEDTTMTVGQRLARIAELVEDDNDWLATQVRLVDSLSARHDSIRFALSASAIPDSLLEALQDELAEAHEDVEDEQGDLASLRATTENRRERFEWQTSVLRGYPSDSSIVIDDLRDEAEIRFPDGNPNEPSMTVNLPAWLPRSRATQRLTEARTSEEIAPALAEFARNTIERLSVVMFLLLPVFALLLKVIYVRRKWFYTEHLIFGLHTHAFAFFVFSIVAISGGFSIIPDAVSGILAMLSLTIPLYFYVALKRVYGQGWIKTAFKALLLGWIYAFVLLVGLLAAITIAAAFG